MNRWQVVGASVRGPDHEREDAPCQDAWAWSSCGAGGTCLCLCDGAGSAPHAEVGARVVATAVVAAWTEAAVSDAAALVEAMRSACAAGRAALLRTAVDLEVAPAALACTLIAVACIEDTVVVAHLGDGAVVGLRAGELVVLSAPDRGEYVNETWFVTSAAWEAHLRVSVHAKTAALCVLTDGCQEAALVRAADRSPFSPFFAPLFEFTAEITDAAAASAEVLQLLDGAAMRKSSGDDKTLALAWRQTSP